MAPTKFREYHAINEIKRSKAPVWLCAMRQSPLLVQAPPQNDMTPPPMRPARVSHQTPSALSRHKAMLLSALAEKREGEVLDVSQRTEWTQSVWERKTEYSSQAKGGDEAEERGVEGKDWIFCPKVPMEG